MKRTIFQSNPGVIINSNFVVNSQIGTIGGTIGLFCGLSLISIVEVIYWIYKTVLQSLLNYCNPRGFTRP